MSNLYGARIDGRPLEEKFLNGAPLTRREKETLLRQFSVEAYKAANNPTYRIPTDKRLELYIRVMGNSLRTMERLGAEKDTTKLQNYVQIVGLSRSEVQQTIHKLSDLRKSLKKANAVSFERPREPENENLVDSSIEDEAILRRQIAISYKLADLTVPRGKPAEQSFYVSKHIQVLDTCLQMMETLGEERLLQFQNIVAVTKQQVEEALEKFGLKQAQLIPEVNDEVAPTKQSSGKGDRPASRLTSSDNIPAVLERGRTSTHNSRQGNKPPVVKTTKGTKTYQDIPRSRSSFTGLLNRFGHGSNS